VPRLVIWAPKARRDLFQHLDYVAADSLQNAERVRTRILSRVVSLASMTTGRAGRVFGTYETYVPKTSLIICYEVPDQKTLQVLRIIHTSRNWTEGQWPRDAE
jgi:plasmid stabilization system protein ParE